MGDLRGRRWFETRPCCLYLPIWALSLTDLSLCRFVFSEAFGLTFFQAHASSEEEFKLKRRAALSKVFLENLVQLSLLTWLFVKFHEDSSDHIATPTFILVASVTFLDLIHGLSLLPCQCLRGNHLHRTSYLHQQKPSLNTNLVGNDEHVYTFSSRTTATSTAAFHKDDFYKVDGEA